MLKMKSNSALFINACSSLLPNPNRFKTPTIRNAFFKRTMSNGSFNPSWGANKSKRFTNKLGLFQVFQNPSFSCGVAVGVFEATGTVLVWNFSEGVLSDKLMFEEWMRKHGRVYKDAKEKQERFLIFQRQLRIIESLNNDVETNGCTYGLNYYSDRTKDEWRSLVFLPCDDDELCCPGTDTDTMSDMNTENVISKTH